LRCSKHARPLLRGIAAYLSTAEAAQGARENLKLSLALNQTDLCYQANAHKCYVLFTKL